MSMKSDSELNYEWRGLTRSGSIGSFAYLLIVLTLSILNHSLFSELKADGWATFISGIFSPLAFLWLVLGFLQQGHELRQSAQALRLQGEELRNSVEQQRQLVEASREQIELERETLAHERAERERLRLPVLRPKPAGGSTSGSIVERVIHVENQGTACTNLRIKIFRAGELQTQQDFPSLGKGETIGIRLQTDSVQNIMGYILQVDYVDRDNYDRVERFRTIDLNESSDYFSFKFVLEE